MVMGQYGLDRGRTAGKIGKSAPARPGSRFLVAFAIGCAATIWGMGFLCRGHAADLVTGVNPKWARGVADSSPVRIHDGTGPRAPLYFWMIYEGNKAALAYIRKNRTLPIRHRWTVWVAGVGESELPDISFTEDIRLSVGNASKKNMPALVGSVENTGKFQWRTWSMKRNVSRGRWQVEVLYTDSEDSPVFCEDRGQLKPCVYMIEIR